MNVGSPQKSRIPDLSLSLGTSLQPALEVDDNLLRQADEIFEKEQEFVVNDSTASEHPTKKAELFINKLGYVSHFSVLFACVPLLLISEA